MHQMSPPAIAGAFHFRRSEENLFSKANSKNENNLKGLI
jgi:hypothetical protein